MYRYMDMVYLKQTQSTMISLTSWKEKLLSTYDGRSLPSHLMGVAHVPRGILLPLYLIFSLETIALIMFAGLNSTYFASWKDNDMGDFIIVSTCVILKILLIFSVSLD